MLEGFSRETLSPKVTQTVDKVYSYTKIHDISSPTQFRPPRPGGVAFPFRKDELGDCHPLKPLYNIILGVWGAAPIGFPEGENDCAGVWPAQLG